MDCRDTRPRVSAGIAPVKRTPREGCPYGSFQIPHLHIIAHKRKKDFLSEVLFVLVREGGVEPPRPE